MSKTFIVILIITLTVTLSANSKIESEKKEVKNVIHQAIDAIYNKVNIIEGKRFYHPEFVLLITRKNKLWNFSLLDLLNYIKQENIKENISIKIRSLDLVGNTAAVFFDFYRGGKRTCADFVSLYKFNEGWRIVSQTTYHYKEP